LWGRPPCSRYLSRACWWHGGR